ncbi:MAG TPA: NAD(P)H-hydrate dehydratase [Urbifossiella sp.]|jgi:NAD(P)H-hydrate epimerase|nr:NAD(P)H-hydrate dehydratase [Urbifossiella sp.]
MSDAAVTPVNELPRWARRATDGHKGTYGKVLVIAGSRGMAGAAVLVGRGALRAGAGLVHIACPACAQPVVAAGHPCYMTVPLRQHADGSFGEGVAAEVVELARASDAVAIGPGLGRADDTAALVRTVVRDLPRTPLVVDADGLHALGLLRADFHGRPVPPVFTPHPGEFARLEGVPVDDVVAHREELAVRFAERTGAVVLVKGAGTVVTDGRRVYRNSTGNPGMATGGSGDVLTGVVAALLGQGLAPFEATVLAAWVHGRAGDLAAATLGQTGLTAADLPEALPAAFRELESHW